MLEELARGECHLCGEKHPPQFHCFAARTYRADDKETNITTQVPRVFCETNYRIRKQTGEPKQYTLTILPGFLIPYSTVPVDPVHAAVNSYITGGGLKQVGAAMRMRCLNPISFRLFLNRVRKRLDGWIVVLIQLLHSFEGQLKELDTGRTEPREPKAFQDWWVWFVWLAAECVRLYARIPEAKVVGKQFQWQYIYSLLSRRQMGLGP